VARIADISSFIVTVSIFSKTSTIILYFYWPPAEPLAETNGTLVEKHCYMHLTRK